MERESSGLTKVFLRFSIISFLGFSFLVGMEKKDSNCIGRALWSSNFGETASCGTLDGRIEIQKNGYSSYLLPPGVCKLSQIWIKGDFVNWERSLVLGFKTEKNNMNLLTGEIGVPNVIDNSYFVSPGVDPYGC